jgi:hypothetical protein
MASYIKRVPSGIYSSAAMASQPIRPVYNVLQWQRNKDVLEIPRCGWIPAPYLGITCSAASSVLLRSFFGAPSVLLRLSSGDRAENHRTTSGKPAQKVRNRYAAGTLQVMKMSGRAAENERTYWPALILLCRLP